MCGIAGIAGFRNDELVKKMTACLHHRGPDDSGFFFNDRLSLGMRRLSIIDIEGGRQPMQTAQDRVVLVFNGEIYNFKALQDEIRQNGIQCRTNSDTETILHGYMLWGLDVVDKLNGMFALAIADLRERPRLCLIRDRLGVKPLYYHFQNGALTFGSEIKSILENPGVTRRINPQAVDHYLKLRYVPGHESMLEGIRKLPAGSMLTYSEGDIRIHRYWSVPTPATPRDIDLPTATEALGEKMRMSIKRRMVADVPVGAFLSGGLDSSVIVALMGEISNRRIDTFSVGFGSRSDETTAAASVAATLGTRHHEIVFQPTDFALVDKIAWHLDEPVGDAIVLPMYLLAREARKSVKVILAGEGADELFGGYLFHKVLAASQWWRRRCPRGLRLFAGRLLKLTPHQLINLGFSYPARLGAKGKERLVTYLSDSEHMSIGQQYHSLISLFSETELDWLYTPDFALSLKKRQPYYRLPGQVGHGDIDAILSLQFNDWLPDDILMKLDKMTMANSIEGREPFLDHELVSFAQTLPGRLKIRGWQDKRVLRSFAEKILPSDTARQPKKPFYIPVDRYFSSPAFKDIFDAFRDDNRIGSLFTRKYFEALSLNGTAVLDAKQLFALIMLNAWCRAYGLTI